MHLPLVLFSAFLLVGATVDGDEAASPLEYGCNDLVVIGRVATMSEASIPDGGDLPNWNSRWQLRVQIKRVLRGSETRRLVAATAISHAQIRGDRDFMIVLSPVHESYELQTAALWNEKPRPALAQTCS